MKTITITPKKPQIDEKLKSEIKTLCEEECQVIVHCSILLPPYNCLRIWKNTNLIAHNSGKKSSLIHAENITFYPQWTYCEEGRHYFTLFFKGLPKNCEIFNLIEDIPETGGFIKENITRNNTDVYHILL